MMMADTPKNASPVSEVEIQASQIIERLEEAAEKALEAVTLLENSSGKDPQFKEADLGLNGECWNINQGFLQAKSKDVPQILSFLEDLIIFENDETEENEVPTVTSLAPLSNIAKFAFVIQGVASFANTLERTHLNNLNSKIHNDTTRWINNLFRVNDYHAFYHDEPLEGLVRLTRMLLHYKYPKYLELGFECLGTNPPVIYSTMYSSLGIVQHICHQLGLSLSCIHLVSGENNFESQQKIDINCLEKLILEDKAANKIPLLIFADAGTPITGHADDLLRLQELCQHEDIWLHVRGHNLAALAIMNTTKPLKVADSITLSLGAWLGTPGLPTITLYKQIQAKNVRNTGIAKETCLPLFAGLVNDHFQKSLVALPVWFTLQVLGREEIQSRIKESLKVSEILLEKLSKYTCLRLLSPNPVSSTMEDLINKPVTSPASVFETTTSTVVFQFVPSDQNSEAPYKGKIPQYYNKLNSWLGQILQRDVPQINVEICELEYAGLVLRICSLEAIIPINDADIELFFACLEQQLDILSATVRLKSTFQQCVESNPSLQLVEIEGWAGLGGVRYVPQNIDNIENDQYKQNLNKLNVEIVNKLRATDAAFSLGEGREGLVCVRFGMVTGDTDIEELLSLVTTIGKNVEESSKFLEAMVEIVKKGIETATIDLQKENEERLWQEGILRHVPVFGSLVNWWAPKTKETGIKGRSLNLQAGVVESTENIYRYHMQLQQGASSPLGTKSPPQPLVQTPIVAMDSNELFVILNRLCSNLQSEDRKKRKQALDGLNQEIFENSKLESFDEIFQEIEKNVWKSLYDQSEAVRDSCITLLSKFVAVLKPDEKFVGELIPLLLWRLGDKEVNEPSEEVRLKLISLLNSVIIKYNKCCGPFVEDIVQILSKTLVDSFPKIRQESCTCVCNLAFTLSYHFYNHSNTLIKPILSSFSHQHYRMRVAAIEALGKVVQFGNTKNLPSQEVFGSLAEKLFDTTPNVRSAVTKVIGNWLLNLHDRYSFFTKMIPLILTSLCDELPELREEAWEIWSKAGLQYEQENEQDLKDKMDFLYEKPEHYPPNVLRPNLGCRTLVQRNICQIRPALSKELEDWKNDIRIKSAQLLCWLVLHAETDITQHTENLLLTMYKVCNQTDIRIVENVEKSAEYIAYFVSPDVYMQLIVPVIQDICTAGHLCVLAALIRGSKPESLKSHVVKIGELLSDDSICRVRKNDYQYQLLKCVDALLSVVKKDCLQIGNHLFLVVITTKVLSQGRLSEIAQSICLKLSETLENESVIDLYRDYTEMLLQKIEPSAETWTSVSCERFIFQAILEESGPVVGLFLPKIMELLKKVMKTDGDPIVKSKLFALMSSLLAQRDRILSEADDSTFQKFITSFIQDVISPNLVWHAGRTAEALRTVVVACLCAALLPQNESAHLFGDVALPEHVSEECTLHSLNKDLQSDIFNTLFPLLLNSFEDCAVKTRLYSLKAAQSLVGVASKNDILTPDHVNQSYPLVLKRLDDVCNDVRVSAVQYLILMYNHLPSTYNPEGFEPHLDSLYGTLLIHLDDPDEKFQEHMTEVLNVVGKASPKLLYEKLDKAKSRFRNYNLCNKILDRMKSLYNSNGSDK